MFKFLDTFIFNKNDKCMLFWPKFKTRRHFDIINS